jgi:DNA-binding NarL/FixJ family response regulator
MGNVCLQDVGGRWAGPEPGRLEGTVAVTEADADSDAPAAADAAPVAAFEQGGQRPARLTPRDLLVLMLISRGYRRHQVAHGLQVPVAIVDRHVENAVAALAARDLADAMARAHRRGLIGVPGRAGARRTPSASDPAD